MRSAKSDLLPGEPTVPERILRFGRHWSSFDADSIMAELGLSRDVTNQWLSRLARAGKIERVSFGLYRVAKAEGK